MSSQYEKRKAKEKKTSTTTEEPTSATPNYAHVAYDVVFEETERKYVRVKLEYDIDSGDARVIEKKPISDNQPVAIKKMVELFTRKVLRLPTE